MAITSFFFDLAMRNWYDCKEKGYFLHVGPIGGRTMRRKSKTIYLSNTKRRRNRANPKAILMGIIAIGALGGTAFAFLPNAYAVSVDGEVIGYVDKKEYIDTALQTVEKQLENKYNTEVQIEGLDELKKVHASKKDMIDPNKLPSYLRENMDVTLKFQKLFVDGKEIAVIESEEVLDELKEELKDVYFDDKNVKAEFKNKVKLEEVYTTEDELVDMETLVDLCKKRQRKEVTYTVADGDTLWGIASKLGIDVQSLIDANEGVTPKLKIGQELKATVRIPVLGLELIEEPAKETNKEAVKQTP